MVINKNYLINGRATGYTLLGHLPCKGAIHTKEMIAKLITENQLTIIQ